MSYKEAIFEDPPDYLGDFQKITCHGNTAYTNDQGRGRIYSYSTENGNGRIDYPSTEVITLEELGYDAEFLRQAENVQFDIKRSSDYLVEVTDNAEDKVILRYDPMMRHFNIPDVFHHDNAYWHRFLEFMEWLEDNWSQAMEVEAEEDPRKVVIGTNIYKLEGQVGMLSDHTVTTLQDNLQAIQRQVDRRVRQIRQSISRNVGLPSGMIRSLSQEGISAYSTRDGRVDARRTTEYTLKTLRGRGDTMAYEMPETYQYHSKATFRLKLKTVESDGELPLTVQKVMLDTPHPHRHGGTVDGWKKYCTGDLHIQGTQINGANEVIDIFNDLESTLQTGFLPSFASSNLESVEGLYNSSTYREVYDDIRESE